MTVYLISLAFMLTSSLVIRSRRTAIVLFGMVMWFLAAFRNLNLGLFDTTGNYYMLYSDTLLSSFGDIATNATSSETAFFELVDKAIQVFVGSNYQAYIAILSLFYIICFCVALMHFSNKRKWSVAQTVVACVVYFSLVYFYSYTMLRQFAALSVLVAFAYPCVRKRKLIGFLVAIAFASMLHSTALVFLVSYPLCVFVPYRKKCFAIVLGLAALGTFAPQIVMTALDSIPILSLQVRLDYIAYGIYKAETVDIGYGTLALLTLLAVFYIWQRKGSSDPAYTELLWLVSLGIVFQGWSHVVVEFYRVAMYFIVFNAFLLPERLQLIQDRKLRVALTLTAIGVLLAYGLFVLADNAGVIPYSFCWDIGAWSQ